MTEVNPKQGTLLVVEDELEQCALVSGILRRAGYQVLAANGVKDAQEMMAAHRVDVVFSDWQLAQEDGLELLNWLRENHPQVGFILATGHGSIHHAVHTIRAGADDYLVKPYQRESLLFAVERTCRARQLLSDNAALNRALTERDTLVDLVGKAPCMQQLYQRLERIADTRATILITGESGTGKELAARALHQLSGRSQGAFVAVNCAAVPDSLAEAEFFGAEKGAFTGAYKRQAGKFEQASGGTLFLDEIGEMPLTLQAKLLRSIQEGVVTRLGGHEEIPVDVRLVTATNRDLSEAVAQGTFREDLFYRLNVVPVSMPPLRQRREDIPALARHFSSVAARRHGLPEIRFPAAVLSALMAYHWPGNVRELGNVVERMVLMTDDGNAVFDEVPSSVRAHRDVAATIRLPAAGLDWENMERSFLEQALERCGGNRTRAAQVLNLSYKAFLYRLEKYRLS